MAVRSSTLHTRVQQALKRLAPFGISIPGADFFMAWWKKLGLRWTVALCVVIFVPISEISLLNFAMKTGVPYMVGDFGVSFEAEDWDLHLFGLRGTAHNVRLARDGRSAPVLTADEIEFNITLGALIGRLFGRPQLFDEIIIRDADLKLEQSLTGDLNWIQFISSVPAGRRTAVARGQYQTRALVLDRMRIEYLEHIPASSGGGVIQSAQARVFADDVSGFLNDVILPEDAGDMPTTFELKGRTSDGVVQVSGRTALFPPAGQASAAPVELKVYLDNLGMAAYGKTVATTSLMPVRGTMRGTVDIRRRGDELTCRSTLIADEVEFAPNPRIVLVRAQYDSLANALRGYRTSGPFDPCTTDIEDPRQTATGVLASFNTQTTLTAPATVREAAMRDEHAFGRSLAASATADITGRLAREAGKRAGALVGGKTGEAAEKQSGNALAKGVRSVGSGFKKLFGR